MSATPRDSQEHESGAGTSCCCDTAKHAHYKGCRVGGGLVSRLRPKSLCKSLSLQLSATPRDSQEHESGAGTSCCCDTAKHAQYKGCRVGGSLISRLLPKSLCQSLSWQLSATPRDSQEHESGAGTSCCCETAMHAHGGGRKVGGGLVSRLLPKLLSKSLS
ncbi:hypothetical protein ABPG75_011749 [Micractinium tetrahymenae]